MFDLFILQHISSLSKELLRAKRIGTSQTERTDYLEDQCTLLSEKVNDLLRIEALKEEEQIKEKETLSTAVQTDDSSKARYLYLFLSTLTIHLNVLLPVFVYNWLNILYRVVPGGK